MQVLWRFIPERRKHLTFAPPKHYDFRTPEYDVLRAVTERKWELARGVGHSFGANRHERPEDIVTEKELIQMLCDVVSKNGNPLLGVGPRPDGTIPELQQAPLRAAAVHLEPLQVRRQHGCVVGVEQYGGARRVGSAREERLRVGGHARTRGAASG